MAGKAGLKKAKTKKVGSAKRTDLVLSVELLQLGYPQDSGSWKLSGRDCSITFGSSARANLSAPVSDLAPIQEVFRVSGGRAQVVLHPGWAGYLSTGKEFGRVSEFLFPRGSIAPVAAVDNPMVIDLHSQARGILRVWGFEVAFKVSRLKDDAVKRSIFSKNGGAFLPPEVDSSIERSVIGIGLLTVGFVAAGILLWLLKAPVPKMETLRDLPERVLAQLVHPSHFVTLPAVLSSPLDELGKPENLSEQFNPAAAVVQAVNWVEELQKRWNAAERGVDHVSPFGVLLGDSVVPRFADLDVLWWETTRDRLGQLQADRKSGPWNVRFYKPLPPLAVDVAGGVQGSLLLRLERRLEMIEKVQHSLRSMILTEHEFLRTHLKDEEGIRFRAVLQAPLLGKFVGSRPHEEFYREAERFAIAEAYAEDAATSRLRQRIDAADRKNEKEMKSLRSSQVPVVWLGGSGLVGAIGYGDELGFTPRPKAWSRFLSGVTHNAWVASGQTPIPPEPRPIPMINEEKVMAVLESHREEIRSCYNRALRQKPGLRGEVIVRWVIDLQGNARDPRVVKSDFENNDLFFCLRARIARWQFPKPVNGSYLFEYPFRFLLAQRN